MHSFFFFFSLFLFIIFHSMTCDTSSNIDTQVDTTSFSISDVQQPPAIDEEQAAPEPETGPGSSVNAGTSPEELLADENGACLDPNQNNPHNKTRVRRESPSTDYCPFLLVPESRLIEGPQEPGAGQNEGDGVRRYRPKKPQRFDPLNMPTFQDGETIENPCTRYTLARIPVCDSGYFGPTNNLAECRLWTPFESCVTNLENLWCCIIVRLGFDPEYPYYGLQCKLQPTRSPPRRRMI